MNVKEKCNVPFEIPSKVTDRKFIRMPKNGKIVENDDEWSRCGKWIVAFLDHESHDSAWIELHRLIEDDTLLMIKSSTLKIVEEGKIILCYTSPGKSKIKKAAIAIKRIVPNNCFAFAYKTNETTERSFQAVWSSENSLHNFFYTPKGKLYEKDSLQRWTLVNDEENTSDCGILGESFTSKEKLGISLLSAYKAHEETFYLKEDVPPNSLFGYWSMKCDFTHKDEIGLTEMERVQEAAEEFFRQGVFPKIIRPKTKEKFSEFYFYIKQLENHKDVLTYATQLRNSIYYPHPIYFYMWDDVCRKYSLKYMHFADGEFFELVFIRSRVWKAVIN